jgi:hypothetical protein
MISDGQLLRLYVELTPRQREVLQLVSTGFTNFEASRRLHIAPYVVAEHLTNIYQLLATMESLPHGRANRYALTHLYADFFQHHPELDNFRRTSHVQHRSGCDGKNLGVGPQTEFERME